MTILRPWALLGATVLALCANLASAAGSAATTTSLVSATNPATLGQTIILTAHVAGGTPTGTVTFKDGTVTLGTATLNGGSATWSLVPTGTGVHSLSASYSGNSALAASNSTALSQTILPASTSVKLSSSANPSVVAKAFTLTAQVSGVSPAGTVTFLDAGQVLGSAALSNGQASFTVSLNTATSHSMTAAYGGNASNTASTSSVLAQVINPATTTTQLVSSANPVPVGQTVALTATVSGAAPTGSVTFRDGTTSLGSAALVGGVAKLNVSFSGVSTHSLTALYSGNASNAASTSLAVSESVAVAASSVTLSSGANPAVVGQALSLTAHVVGLSPTGTVTFKDGSSVLGTASLSSGSASLAVTFGATGAHALTASYGGNGLNGPSSSAALGETVNLSPSITVLTSNPAATSVGQSIALTARVTGYSPTGSVTFKDGTTVLGTAALSAGSAVLTTTLTTAGSHSLTAAFAGNALNAASTSSTVPVLASLAPTTTALTASSTTATVGKPITLTAKVTGVTPSGSVTFRSGASTLGTATLISGTAVLSASFPATGTYPVAAAYLGNANNVGSTSSTASIVVTAAPPSKTPDTSNGIAYWGGSVMSSGVNVYFIWYGNWAGDTTPSILTRFINGLGGSAYFHTNTTYTDSSGKGVTDSVTLMGSSSDTAYSQGKNLTDAGVTAVVSSAISSGQLPRDPNGFYVVMSSQDVNETSGFCTQYCGWHDHFTLGNMDIKYSFVGNPNRCPGACIYGGMSSPNGNRAADGMASVLVHELNETVTDQDLNAWFTNNGGQEDGDLCAWTFGTIQHASDGTTYNLVLPTGNFFVQQNWLNAFYNNQHGSCVMAYP